MLKSILLGLFLAISGTSFIFSTPSFAAEKQLAPEVSLDELKTIINNKKAVLLDANGTSTYKNGHIPGAIDYEKSKAKLASLLPADKNALIVAYCGGPLCTAWEDAAKTVQTMGYKNVKHFKGGIKVWKEAKMTVEKS